MNVGITYDLRSDYLKMGYSMEETAEFDKEDTIEGIEQALHENGYQTSRIGNFKDLMKRLLAGDRWDIVFNISEGLYGDGRESVVPALLDQFRIPYVFSGPATLALALNKFLTKRIIREAGVPTPDFIVVREKADLNKTKPPFPLFVKPVAEGTGKGITNRSIIENENDYRDICAELLTKYNQPVLVEKYLAGTEVTVGVIGNGSQARVIGGMELMYFNQNPRSIYSYETKENWKELLTYDVIKGDLLRQASDLTLKVWEAIDGLDGGRVDLKADELGRLQFIEVNPLAGLNPYHSDLPMLAKMNGIDYNRLIGMIMDSAIQRLKV